MGLRRLGEVRPGGAMEEVVRQRQKVMVWGRPGVEGGEGGRQLRMRGTKHRHGQEAWMLREVRPLRRQGRSMSDRPAA